MSSDDISYQVESYSSCIEEMKLLYQEHYEELSVTKMFTLSPSYDTYIQLDKLNLLCTVTCRVAGNLVGYILAIISPSLHYSSMLIASEDIYFLKKEYRKGRTGINMFKYFEKQMKNRGVNRIMITTKVHKDNSKLFEYLGYSFVEKLFSKVI